MPKNNYVKFTLTLIGILLLMTACSGSSPTDDSAQAIEPTPTLVVVGSTIDKPVPFGYDIILKNIVISVNEINRPANEIVAGSSGEPPVPVSGQEFLLIRITNQCISTETPTCFVGQTDFQLLDAAGKTVAPVIETSSADGFYAYEEFPRSTSNKGYLTFLVEKDVDYPILTYNSFQKSTVYMSLAY